jgi:hypothetical protein
MPRRTKIKCSLCSKDLFYLPLKYEMSFDVICCECMDGKKTKSKTTKTASSNYAKTKKGIRDDVHPNAFFRSATEANVARIFELLKVEWKFEERVFTFNGRQKRPFQYIIDFEIIKANKKLKEIGLDVGFIEVKGWMDSRSRSKIRCLKKYYPEEFKDTTVILYSKSAKKAIEFCEKVGVNYIFYDDLTKVFKDKIPNWE